MTAPTTPDQLWPTVKIALLWCAGFFAVFFTLLFLGFEATSTHEPYFVMGLPDRWLELHTDQQVVFNPASGSFFLGVVGLLLALYLVVRATREDDPPLSPASPAMPPPTAPELRDLEKQVETMLHHENELLNHRIQWFLTLSGFLFTAVAIYGNQPGRNWFGTVLAAVGLLTCISFGAILSLGRRGWKSTLRRWQTIRLQHKAPFHDVGVYGVHSKGFLTYLAPTRLLPWVMGLGWVGLVVFVWVYPGVNPPGSYSVVPYKPSEQQLKIVNTREGTLK